MLVDPLPKRDNGKLLEKQNEKCADCEAELKVNVFNRPLYHYCRYTGFP